MKTKRRTRARRGESSPARDRMTRIAAATAPTIIALQGTAFARPDQTASPTATQIFAAPLLGPAELAAAGAVIATVGAYRLMKDRRRKGEPRDETQ